MDAAFEPDFLSRDDCVLPSQGGFPERHRRPSTPRLSRSPSPHSPKYAHQLPTIKPRIVTPPEENPAKPLRLAPASNVVHEAYGDKLAIVKKLIEESPERPVSLILSGRDFSRLLKDIGYDQSDRKYPRYSFDSLTSAMTIQRMSSPVHELIPSIFLHELHKCLADLPASLRSRIHVTGSEDTRGFGGKYAGSQKAADLSIKLRDEDGKRRLKCVFEVGFAENYEDLVQDTRKWLEGKETVVLVVLAKVEEIPQYQNPLKNLSDTQLANLNLPGSHEIEEHDFCLGGDYGPVIYKGLCWVERMISASLETWKLDPLTNLAKRDENPINLFGNAPFRLKLSDVLGATIENDREISVSSEEFCSRLKDEIRALALIRYQKAWDDYAKTDDHGYELDFSMEDED